MWPFKRKLDLIDLEAYEAECIRAVRDGHLLRPPPHMVRLPEGASIKDFKKAEDNYLLANEIYERYKAKQK